MYIKNKILLPIVMVLFVAVLAGCNNANTTTTVTTVATTEDTTPAVLTTEYTDDLQLTASYEGKEFIQDGIGEVTFNRCVDGDTARFVSNNTTFTVRFLGIDTPESTATLDPWGKAASHFTCEKLTNAHTIVLQRENEILDSTGSRYLAFVWYDGRLLNLELVEEAYTGTKGLSGSMYANTFYRAEAKTQKTGRGVWGEIDPNYDYSNTATQVTIQQLRENQDSYLGKNVMLEGIVTRVLATSTYGVYIEQDGYGAYIFVGYTRMSSLSEGNDVRLIANVSQYNGLLELSNVSSAKIEVLSTGNVSLPTVVTIPDLIENIEATFVQLNDLVVASIYTSPNGSYTVTAKDSLNHSVDIRVDSNLYPAVSSALFTIGKSFSVSGNVTEYTDLGQTPNYQISLCKLSDVTFNN